MDSTSEAEIHEIGWKEGLKKYAGETARNFKMKT